MIEVLKQRCRECCFTFYRGTHHQLGKKIQAEGGGDRFQLRPNRLWAGSNAKLLKLLDAIGDLELGKYLENDIDTFSDAYEYLMTMYASSTGKSGGELFTPQEVSALIARLTVLGKTQVRMVCKKFASEMDDNWQKL